MQAPRLRVGVLIDGDNPVQLFDELQQAGHDVTPVRDPALIGDVELVVIAVADSRLADTVEQLARHSHRGQMFVHTSLVHGIQVMDPLETEGAIVMAAFPLGEDRWVACATDELGETVVGLLVGEMGGSIVEIADSQRQQLAAALSYAGFIRTAYQDAVRFLDSFLSDIDVCDGIVNRSLKRSASIPSLAALTAQYESIEEPGRKRLFRDLARRQAEVMGTQDIELWAIQEEDR